MSRSESYTLPSLATTSDAAQPFSVMKIDFAPQIDCIWRGAQYMTSGSKTCHDDSIFGCDALIGISRYPGGSSDGSTYQPGRYTLMPTKSSGEAIVLSSSSVNVGEPPPASARYSSVYRPSSITVVKPALRSRVAFSAAATNSGASITG